MIVRITRAKVGHCQAPYNQRGPLGGRFGFDLLKPMSSMLSRSDLTEAATQVMNRSQRSVHDNAGSPGVLHVLHDRGGGTEKYLLELVEATRASHRHYFLRILGDRWRLIDTMGKSAPRDYRWRIAGDGSDLGQYDCARTAPYADQWLSALCAWLDVGLIHVHSLVGDADDVTQLLVAAGVPYCYTAHDMYLPCPTVYLIDAHGRYCNATTDVRACQACLAHQPGLDHIDIAQWRARHRRFLAGASAVFAPSPWARDTLLRYFPEVQVKVSPPLEAAATTSSAPLPAPEFSLPDDACRHFAVLGAIGPEKGARHVERMVERIRARTLPLRLVVVGYTDRESRCQSDDKVLTVHGPYDVAHVAALLDHYRVSVVAFPGIWPETFGYTLSEAWRAGRATLVPPTGALAERVRGSGAGWIIDRWPDIDALLDQILDVTEPKNRAALANTARLARQAANHAPDADDPTLRFYSSSVRHVPSAPATQPMLDLIRESAAKALATG